MVGSFAASLALFAPPVVLLGMVTPFAIRLAATGVEDAGRVAGRVFALSTAGSLIGTFVPALITIPLIGTQRTLIGAAVIIASSALPLLAGRRLAAGLVVTAVLVGLLAVPPAVVKAQEGLIHEEESRYQFIQVVQSGDERRLYLNEGYAIHSVWRPDTVLTGGEWDMFLAAPPLLGRPARRATTLGNAAGTTARAYGVYYPEAQPSTASSSTPPSPPSDGAGSGSTTTRASPCTRPTRARSSRRRTSATTSSSSTPIASPTCPSTWRRASSSGSAGSDSRPAASSPSTCPRCPATTGSRRPWPARSAPSSPRWSPGRR